MHSSVDIRRGFLHLLIASKLSAEPRIELGPALDDALPTDLCRTLNWATPHPAQSYAANFLSVLCCSFGKVSNALWNSLFKRRACFSEDYCGKRRLWFNISQIKAKRESIL